MLSFVLVLLRLTILWKLEDNSHKIWFEPNQTCATPLRLEAVMSKVEDCNKNHLQIHGQNEKKKMTKLKTNSC